MPRSLIAVGSNVGDRSQFVAQAMAQLAALPLTRLAARSALSETRPVGGPRGQDLFLNAAACVETSLSPEELLAELQSIEGALGRLRAERWGPRTADLDLLLYDERVIDTPRLTVPHPRMAFRRFVLEPAAEIAGEMVHPTIGWTIQKTLSHLDTALPYVAICGTCPAAKSELAQGLAAMLVTRFLPDLESFSQTPSHLDQPSPDYERQLQFLDYRRALLDAERWPQGKNLAISGFYFDECLATARLELDDASYQSFCNCWELARSKTVSPKLLVMLDPPLDQARRALGRRLRGELLRLAGRRGLGPVLYVRDTNREAQLEEISAAIQAMN